MLYNLIDMEMFIDRLVLVLSWEVSSIMSEGGNMVVDINCYR